MRGKTKGTILLLLLLCSVFLGGCSLGDTHVVVTSGFGSRDVFKIGGKSCSTKKAKVYLSNNQNIFGNSYGINLWERKFKIKELTRYVKDVTLSELTRIVCMDLLAKEQEVQLTEDEIKKTKEAARVYFDSLTEEEIAFMDVTENDIQSMYEEYALAQKVYQSLTKSVDEEVSDDEARIMEAMQIFVADEAKSEEVKQKLSAGEDFAAVASNYNQKSAIEITFGRGELPGEVETIAFELDNEQVSDCIPTEEGFYFIKCVNKFNEELTDANKSKIVEKREKEAFDDVYEEFVGSLSSSMNEKAWEEIQLDTSGKIKTDTFFTVFDEHCK